MKIILRIFASAVLVFCFITGNGQNRPPGNDKEQRKRDIFTDPESAAAKAIYVLKALVANEKLKGMVNLSPAEVNQLQVGRAIPVLELSYNGIIKAGLDSILTALLDQSQKTKLLYPLQVNGITKTTALVYGENGKWKLSTAGDNRYVDLIGIKVPENADNIELIEIPGLGISMLGYSIGQQVFYIADRNIDSIKMEKGRPMPEKQALRAITIYARQFDEKYGREIRNRKLID